MDPNKGSLTGYLERFMYLLSILKERNISQSTSWFDYTVISNLEMMIDNYRKLSMELPEKYLIQIVEPLDNIFKRLIEQAAVELGDENEIDYTEMDEIKDDLDEIDLLLKDPFLSHEEINDLLDKRSELLELIKKNS